MVQNGEVVEADLAAPAGVHFLEQVAQLARRHLAVDLWQEGLHLLQRDPASETQALSSYDILKNVQYTNRKILLVDLICMEHFI